MLEGNTVTYNEKLVTKDDFFNYKKNIQVFKVTKFIDSFCEDLKLRLRNMANSKYVMKGEGLDYRIFVTNKKYKELNVYKENLSMTLRRSKNILLLFGFDGTLIRKNAEKVVMVSEGEIVKMMEQPAKSLIKNLESLSMDNRIHVFV